MNQVLSWHRLLAMIVKEFIQLRRDRLTFAMMLGIPLIQLILFGFAINGDPKHLPTVIVAHEQTPFTRAIVQGLENSGYFQLVATDLGEAEADHWLEEGDAQFAVVIPAGFAKKNCSAENGHNCWSPPMPPILPRPPMPLVPCSN